MRMHSAHRASGAEVIISTIRARRNVSKLILGHNELGDAGVIHLFEFLLSPDAAKYRIREVSLNSNKISNAGLLAVAAYLTDNKHLNSLFLQDNDFTADPSVTAAFADAVNSSSLEVLSMATNRRLGDQFVADFLPQLDTPSLREVYLSAMDLTAASLHPIAAYIASNRTQLQTFKCNGNLLGTRAVQEIIRTVENHNYHLLTLELYSNNLAGGEDDRTGGSSVQDKAPTWQSCELLLRRVLMRNAHLKREAEHDALRLLYYARALLLRSTGTLRERSGRCTGCTCYSSRSRSPSPVPVEVLSPAGTGTPQLPTELLHYILSLFAPSLSPSQRVRIYHYAARPETLPRVAQCEGASTGGGVCVPDPSSLDFGGSKVWDIEGPGRSGGCGSGKCMGGGSLVCHREQERVRWLSEVGCNAYEPPQKVDEHA
ncbi:hypothetical protein BD626DRAFT_498506 [Schizophyllum amplum]|uniref:RNI-like protein n=1 Tax=Schizophyllum amplum TaxID=97359 RepID=A0A550CBQ4_9AGAR|nr:hypothetical protein BD626DRAFT_498506 [Auriculariopsis ampla]